jgi:hypothetical protein
MDSSISDFFSILTRQFVTTRTEKKQWFWLLKWSGRRLALCGCTALTSRVQLAWKKKFF